MKIRIMGLFSFGFISAGMIPFILLAAGYSSRDMPVLILLGVLAVATGVAIALPFSFASAALKYVIVLVLVVLVIYIARTVGLPGVSLSLGLHR
jgi:hypothetical protein